MNNKLTLINNMLEKWLDTAISHKGSILINLLHPNIIHSFTTFYHLQLFICNWAFAHCQHPIPLSWVGRAF